MAKKISQQQRRREKTPSACSNKVGKFSIGLLETADNVYSASPKTQDIVFSSFDELCYSQPDDYQADRGSFHMMYRETSRPVRKRIDRGQHGKTCYALWITCMEFCDQDTGEVLLDRDELAKEASCSIHHVSRCMKLLDEYGAVFLFKKKGRVKYQCNPVVGWNGRKESKLQKQSWWILRRTQQLAKQKMEELERHPELPLGKTG